MFEHFWDYMKRKNLFKVFGRWFLWTKNWIPTLSSFFFNLTKKRCSAWPKKDFDEKTRKKVTKRAKESIKLELPVKVYAYANAFRRRIQIVNRYVEKSYTVVLFLHFFFFFAFVYFCRRFDGRRFVVLVLLLVYSPFPVCVCLKSTATGFTGLTNQILNWAKMT